MSGLPRAMASGSSRVSRFMAVGALGFAIQLGAMTMLISIAEWAWLPATLIAVEIAVVHNFFWHEHWTWKDRGRGNRESPARRFMRFHLTTGLTSLAGNAVLMAVYVRVIGMPALAASVLAVVTISMVNFIVSDRCVFRSGQAGNRSHNHEKRGAGMAHSDALLRSSQPVRPGVSAVVIAMAAVAYACAASAEAAPAPETVAAWNRYVAETEARIERERLSATRTSAEIAAEGESINIPSGTISRWRGSMLVPDVSLDQLLHRLQYPGTPPPQEDVAASRVVARTPDSLRVSIRLVRSAIVTVTYDTEHEMRFQRWGPTLATARSVATRIDEVGGDDHGFLWRLNSYWRYRQIANGVMVELESLTLSRHVPAVIRPVAAPIVTRIARESMVRTLEALRRYCSRPVSREACVGAGLQTGPTRHGLKAVPYGVVDAMHRGRCVTATAPVPAAMVRD